MAIRLAVANAPQLLAVLSLVVISVGQRALPVLTRVRIPAIQARKRAPSAGLIWSRFIRSAARTYGPRLRPTARERAPASVPMDAIIAARALSRYVGMPVRAYTS